MRTDQFQYTLYGGTPPHQDVDTSLAAAEEIRPHINRLHAVVLQCLRAMDDATDEQIQDSTGLSGSTVRPRRGELIKLGLVELARNSMGEPIKRVTRSGRSARVYRVVA